VTRDVGMKRSRVLVADDEAGAREALELILEDAHEVVCVEDGLSVLTKIKQSPFDLILLDVNMPGMDGIEVLRQVKAYDEAINVIMISAADRAREATASMKHGAYDYITKPFDTDEIVHTVERALKPRSLEREVQYFRTETALKFAQTQIISCSESMRKVFQLIEKVADATSSVLIVGESGTGKELVARALHARSPRAAKPFVALNCAAVPPELIESELFGHEKGSFTGAHTKTIGKFEYANEGTLLLDEVSSLRLDFQAKLLRVLQEREFTRVGSHRLIKVDVRIIAASNQRLSEMVREGSFRRDLFFRLNVIPIELPPLREREGDVSVLARHFLDKFNRKLNKRIAGISPAAMEVLCSYPWPGNVRELENLIERLVVLGSNDQGIEERDLPFELLIHDDMENDLPGIAESAGLIQARKAFERRYILSTLERCEWNQSETARVLRVHRNTLLQKMKSLDIQPPEQNA
jgi:DNA-binding NtrC family response regulator